MKLASFFFELYYFVEFPSVMDQRAYTGYSVAQVRVYVVTIHMQVPLNPYRKSFAQQLLIVGSYW